MKRKYIAMALGMTLAVSQTAGMTVMAEGTSAETVTEAAQEAGSNTENGESSDGSGQADPSGDSQEQPPEKPDGEDQDSADSNGQGGPGGDGQEQPPEKPDGEGAERPDGNGQGGPGGNGQGQPPEMPDGEGQGGPGGNGQGGPGGGASGVDSYDALNTYTESTEITGEEITSTGTDENAVLVESEDVEVTISDSAITRNSEESTGGDTSSFYGVGAAALATAGQLYVSGSTITTDAKGGAGLFAYGDGVVYVANSTISTSEDTSGGIHVAGGGTLYAWNLNVETQGESSAAIRSDRGSGTMVVDGGTYTSNGTGSPAIYSTADISVNEADLTATGSEAICIEGLNTIRLYNSNLSGNMADNEQNDVTWNVIIYQSMSGDSVEGNGTFEMTGGTLTANNGGMFYTTNTESTIILTDVEIIPSEDNDFFLQVTGNSNARGWGSAGANGADCTFTGISQVMEGDIIWDTISNLDFYMTSGSTLTGAVINDETWAGNGGDGYCSLYIDATSTWIVTGDSTVTNLSNAGTILDENGDTVSIVGTDGTVYVEGSSAYTITVTTYSDSADMSGASVASSWSDHAVEMPEQFSNLSV